MTVEEIPVLIVGAGPAGLVAAAELAAHGIETLLVESRAEQSDEPRATLVSTWSMELMRSWGLEDEVRAGELDVVLRAWACETLRSPGEEIQVGVPTREQAAAVSPAAPACVPQDHLEPVLLRHVRALGARVRFGVELVRLEPRPEGVEAVLRRADGSMERVRARYLIGADGVRSTVRRALGVPMHGPGLMVEAIAAHFHAPLWRLVGERRHTIYWIRHPEADGVLVPSGRDDRWVYGTMAPPGKLDFATFDEREMLRRIRLASGEPKLDVPIERIGRFTFTAKLADRFRDGDAFLIGDAAHRATPRGGTGMNTAIRDGYDLGWKLAWVLRGWAEPHLLDSYEAERRPVAEHNVLRSAQPTGSLRQVSEELHVDLAGRIPHIWVDGPRSTLDLPRPGLTLLTGPEGGRRPCEPARPYRAAPVTVWRLPALTARALGIATGGSLLLRPDAVPARVTAGAAAVAA